MLAPEILVETVMLLPLDNSHGGIQRIELSDLNVARVIIVATAIREWNSVVLAYVISLLGRAGRDPHNTDKLATLFDELDAHPHIDEGDTAGFELLDDGLLRVSSV